MYEVFAIIITNRGLACRRRHFDDFVNARKWGIRTRNTYDIVNCKIMTGGNVVGIIG